MIDALFTLIRSMEDKYSYMRGHSHRTYMYARVLSSYMQLTASEIAIVAEASYLHDIGKLAVNKDVLCKRGSLTPAEYQHIKAHVEFGSSILSTTAGSNPVRFAVRHHHEWYDGAGYPDKLSGERISIVSRLIAIADAFDSMTTSQPYREIPLTFEQACAEIQTKSGSQFCPACVQAFKQACQWNAMQTILYTGSLPKNLS